MLCTALEFWVSCGDRLNVGELVDMYLTKHVPQHISPLGGGISQQAQADVALPEVCVR